ncbi:protein PELPK1-like [Diachasma alloeum]|uniref:protein PELPK1-like n=1 Tax=Diachasma alloeum TaxID=454923 RepID=UPI0007382F1D|nr:protein PELPK1-like [Diachasma alloeum]
MPIKLEVRKNFGDEAAEWNKEVDSSYIALSFLGIPTQLWGSSLIQVETQNRRSETSQIVELSRTASKREVPRIELPSDEFQVTPSQPRTSTVDLSPSKALEPSVPWYPSQPHLATLTVVESPNTSLEQTPQNHTEDCPQIPPGPDQCLVQSLGKPSSSEENANVKDLKEEVIEDPKLPPQMDQIPPLMSLKISRPPSLNRIPPFMSWKTPRPFDLNPLSSSVRTRIPRPHAVDRKPTETKSAFLFHSVQSRSPQPLGNPRMSPNTSELLPVTPATPEIPEKTPEIPQKTPEISEKTPSIPERPRRTLNPAGILGICHHVSRFHRMIRRVQKYPLESRKFPGNPQVLLKIPENSNESRPLPKFSKISQNPPGITGFNLNS